MNLSNPTSVFAVIFYSLQFVLGLPGNLLIIVVYNRKKRKISTDVLIITQAIIDLIAVLLAPLNILKSVTDRFTTTSICRVALFGNNSLAFASLFLTAAIALDRFFYVCRPLGRRTTNRRAFILGVICYFLGGSLTCTKLIFVEPHVSNHGQKTCLVIDTYPILDTLEAWLKTSGFALALVVSTVLYTKIYLTIRKQARIHAQLVSGVSRTNKSRLATISERKSRGSEVRDKQANPVQVNSQEGTQTTQQETIEESGIGSDQQRITSSQVDPDSTLSEVEVPQHPTTVQANRPETAQSTQRVPVDTTASYPRPRPTDRGENRTTKMLMAVSAILLASWLPPIAFFHLRDSTFEIIEHSITAETLVYIGKRLPGLNHIINYFVYSAMNKKFRTDCKRLFKPLRWDFSIVLLYLHFSDWQYYWKETKIRTNISLLKRHPQKNRIVN